MGSPDLTQSLGRCARPTAWWAQTASPGAQPHAICRTGTATGAARSLSTEVFTDATIAWPLIVRAVIERTEAD